MKRIHVVAAIIIENGKVFAAKRKDAGELALKWEFPGGKIEPGETGEAAIIREIMEELSATIVVDRYLMTVEHQYHTFHLTVDAYQCTVTDGTLEISEHVDSRWLPVEELHSLDWAAADIPIVDTISRMLGN